MKKNYLVTAVFGLLMWPGLAQAEQISKPHTFTSGTPANADQVNANFDTVYDQVNAIGGAITVDKNNQVGIGTATPAEKLDVAGRIKGESLQLTVGAQDGYFLVTDDLGVAHWQKVEANADNDPTNELQSLSLVGTSLTLSKSGGTVSIADGDSSSTNELQTLGLVGSTLSLTNGGSVTVDPSSSNELQALSLVGSNLTLSGGGGTFSINDADSSTTNELNTSVTMSGTSLQVTDNGGIKFVDLAEKLGLDSLTDAIYFGAGHSLFLGDGAGIANTFGGFNTSVGDDSLHTNTTGNYNTAIGSSARLYGTTGSNNVSIGAYADMYDQTGANNTIIGYQAGNGGVLHSKWGNVFLGYQAGFNELGSNKLYIANTSTSTPLIYGNFATNALTVNGTLTATGTLAASGNASVAGTSTVTNLAVTGNATMNGSVAIGPTNPVSTRALNVFGDADDAYTGFFSNTTASGASYAVYGLANGNGGAEHHGVHGNASGASVYNIGVYGTATGTGAYAGYFVGPVQVMGNITYTGTSTQFSDERLKENIKPVEDALAKVQGIKGVYFNMKDNPGQTQVGVIAQDVQKVLPEAVSIIDKEDGYLGVSYPSLIPVLIEAVKELKAEKNAEIAALRLENAALLQRIEALEGK